MFLAFLYTAGGLYLLLMRAGLLHPSFMKGLGQSQKHGLLALGGGLLVLGLYTSWFHFYSRTDEGQRIIEMQRSWSKKYNQNQ